MRGLHTLNHIHVIASMRLVNVHMEKGSTDAAHLLDRDGVQTAADGDLRGEIFVDAVEEMAQLLFLLLCVAVQRAVHVAVVQDLHAERER